MKQDLEN